jgi:nitrile hydratase accessory protein
LSELSVELAITGPAAPPRANGEMVFDAPWESRLFGMTLALIEAERFAWGEFQQRLIAAVGRWEAEHPDGEGYRYYDRWAEALDSLLDDLGIVAVETADRPAGHDHHHGREASPAAHDGA